jgi:TonB family protein
MILVAALLGAATLSNAQTPDRRSIELIFDRHKGALYALYGRALRNNPKLEGQLVLQIDIAASGAVTNCRVKSSELNDPAFEAGICSRVQQFQFEPGKAATSIEKQIDFFPAA